MFIGLRFWLAENKNRSYNTSNTSMDTAMNMKIRSESFGNGGEIPSRFTCDGQGVNPALVFENAPKEAKSLVLLVDDPDIPEFVKNRFKIEVWDHWVVFNMPPETKKIDENSAPGGVVGENTSKENKYAPPCPPDREHRYFFKLYALDTILALDKNATKKDVLDAMQRHILSEAELIGKYKRL